MIPLPRATAITAIAVLASILRGDPTPHEQILACFRAEDYTEAVRLIDAQLDHRPDDPVLHYNAACARTHLGEHDQAGRHLLRAVESGYRNFSHMRRDPDLVALREHGAFRALMDARDFADDLISERRISQWRERLDASFRLESDARRRIDFLTPLDPEQQAALASGVAAHLDLVASVLFGDARRHRVLVVVNDVDHPDIHVRGVYRHVHRELITPGDGRTLRHELTHVAHHAHMDRLGQEHRIWVQEGLAALWERYERDGALVSFTANDRVNLAKRLARRGELLAWGDMLGMSARDFQAQAARTYPQVRVMMRFIDESVDVEAWYTAYVASFDIDPTGRLATEQLFGRPLAAIEDDWRAWLDAQSTIVE